LLTDYAVTLVRQCEWMFENGYFLRAELETTGRSCKRSRPDDITSQSPTGMPTAQAAAQAAGGNCTTQWQLHKQQVAAAAAMAAAVPKPPTVLTASAAPTAFTEANAERIRNEGAAGYYYMRNFFTDPALWASGAATAQVDLPAVFERAKEAGAAAVQAIASKAIYAWIYMHQQRRRKLQRRRRKLHST
jgi:hypothetical protein